MIKDLEMVKLSWIIWVSQCNHSDPYKGGRRVRFREDMRTELEKEID